MTPAQLEKLDKELDEFLDYITNDMGRPERRRAMALYLTCRWCAAAFSNFSLRASVAAEAFDRLAADSKGRFFVHNIKGRYPFHRIAMSSSGRRQTWP